MKKIPMLIMVLSMVGCTTYDIRINNVTVNTPIGAFPMEVRDLQNPYRK
jgi:hypothetical protein